MKGKGKRKKRIKKEKSGIGERWKERGKAEGKVGKAAEPR